MRTKQNNLPNGVSFRPDSVASPYRAWLKIDKTLIHLGYYATPMEAILAADFARYMVWGVDYEGWPVGEQRHRHPIPRISPLARMTASIVRRC